jgi:pentapeptide MXKDX repeat protein
MSKDKMSEDKMSEDKMSEDRMSENKMSEDKMSKDKMSKDKMSKDKMSKDKMSKDKMSKDNVPKNKTSMGLRSNIHISADVYVSNDEYILDTIEVKFCSSVIFLIIFHLFISHQFKILLIRFDKISLFLSLKHLFQNGIIIICNNFF